jgi:hypothetical protein
MKKLIANYRERLVEYQRLIGELEAQGTDNLSYSETEELGVYKGKVEMLEEVIQDLEEL